jgi:hypothetical protein
MIIISRYGRRSGASFHQKDKRWTRKEGEEQEEEKNDDDSSRRSCQ